MNVVYVTGNDHKASYFSKMVGLDIPHKKVDVEEIQSLDITEIVTKKVKQAYTELKVPVIVEDTFLSFDSMGKLPGTFIKWFLEEIGVEGLCEVAKSGKATAGAAIAYYDGQRLEIFLGSLRGDISKRPKGDSGFGWNRIFMPEGQTLTLGEMDETDFMKFYRQIKPFDQIREFLDKLEA